MRGTKKAPEELSGAFDFQFSKLIAVVAVGLGNQKFIYVVRLEPAVASKADAVTMEQAQGALHQLAVSWASDISIRQILMASRNANSTLKDLFDSIEDFDPVDLAKRSCIGCTDVP